MKKILILILCTVLLLSLTGCAKIRLAEEEDEAQAYEDRIAELEREIAELQDDQEPDSPDATEAVEEEPTPTPEWTPTGMSDAPQGNPRMYSSYAHMVSLDPARGWADFDYFERLTGPEAVDALVKYEGYDLVDAQAEVMSYAEGGYYEKNTNTQLRTIDLKNVDIRLIIQADGTLIGDIGNPPQADFGDVFAIYNANPDYILNAFTYYITADDNENVVKVEQVYMP